MRAGRQRAGAHQHHACGRMRERCQEQRLAEPALGKRGAREGSAVAVSERQLLSLA